MKKWFLLGSLFIVIVMAGAYLFTGRITAELSSASAYVPVYKNWTVNFSEEMDPETFQSSAVKVLDESDQTVPVSLTWNSTHTSLQIEAPEQGYQIGKQYRLHIAEDVTAASGRNLAQSISHTFETVGDLPNIEDRQQLATLLEERSNKEDRLFSSSEAMEESASTADSAASESNSASRTNTQVQGVDEADIIKMAGNYIFFSRESDTVIAKGNQEDSEIISTIYEENFHPTELYTYNDALVIIGNKSPAIDINKSQASKATTFPGMQTQTAAYLYDITDKNHPEKVREITVEGYHLSSRRVEGHVYLITNFHPPFQVLEDGGSNDGELRPRMKDTAKSTQWTPVPYENMHYIPDSEESQFLTITSFDINDTESEANVVSYLGTSDQIYMSKKHLYTAVSQLPDSGNSVFDSQMAQPVSTEIIQFGLEDGTVSYQASNVVNGTLINQFAMDEREDSFRVAVTTNQWNQNDQSANHIYTFDLNLHPIGKLEGLAKGEHIYSVRFMEKRAYMVTFKQVDPLFVIDLEDPEKPDVLGELKIPGFSNYLHPIGDDYLLGFGQDTQLVDSQNSGEPVVRTDGLKLSLFDITDVENPVEKFTEIIGGSGSYSELNYNHKALYLHPEKNLFGFPVTLFEEKTVHKNDVSYQEQQFVFEGAFLYQVTPENGIKLKETFTHQPEKQESHPDWSSELRRMVSKGDYLYSFSYNQMKVYDLEAQKSIQTVKLPEQPRDPRMEPVEEPVIQE
ncbi:beta-propeller domain-containing protein [Sediminibacillus massiliensis]|uniref:beta-propeller domain-containing protein n=1 Tax=Sediminibacillus massiliensis TaxID=1926277 RepID=UPI0015C36EFB|nr:beta-propeller domain-containing protein [Sediminibacillus massiliensis]